MIPRCDVAVANGRHCDDGPVQGGGHRDELVWVGVLLHHEGEAREDQHPHDHHQGQQAQLLVACLKQEKIAHRVLHFVVFKLVSKIKQVNY